LLEGKGGLYLENSKVAPLAETLVDVKPPLDTDERGFAGVKGYAIDNEKASRLWGMREKLT
jgi:hypothetical protein